MMLNDLLNLSDQIYKSKETLVKGIRQYIISQSHLFNDLKFFWIHAWARANEDQFDNDVFFIDMQTGGSTKAIKNCHLPMIINHDSKEILKINLNNGALLFYDSYNNVSSLASDDKIIDFFRINHESFDLSFILRKLKSYMKNEVYEEVQEDTIKDLYEVANLDMTKYKKYLALI